MNDVEYEAIDEGADHPAAGARPLSADWIKFLVFAALLLLVVLAVAWSRPLIFGRIIPAILGDNITRATLQEDEDTPVKDEDAAAPAGYPAPDVAAPENSAAPENPAAEAIPPAADPAAAPAPEQPGDFPTAVPAQTHLVVAGDNLTKIAQRYHVTVEALIAVNGLQNPNQVLIGDTLIIPQP